MSTPTLSFTREKISEILSFPVRTTDFEDESEQRRLITNKKVIGYTITTPPLTKTQMTTYRGYYTGRYGSYSSFNFASPIDDTTHECRFSSPLKTDYINGYFQLSFTIKVINEDEA